jgi:hypothetical protein
MPPAPTVEGGARHREKQQWTRSARVVLKSLNAVHYSRFVQVDRFDVAFTVHLRMMISNAGIVTGNRL